MDRTDDLHWRKVLTDDFDWPDAGTDHDPGASMDFGKRSLTMLKMLEASKNYRPPEFDLPRAPKDELDDYSDDLDYSHVEGGNLEDAQAQIDHLEQELYRLDASFYRSEKGLGPDKEERFCIGPGGKVVSWTELSSGYSWIGVSGNDTACVVTMADPICKLPASKTQLSAYIVLKGALADMIGDMPNAFRKIQGFHSGDFAVVSLASCAPDQELELQSLEKKHHRLFRFLQEKLEDRSTLSYKETEQHFVVDEYVKLLLERAFNPYKIEVCGWGKLNLVSGTGFRMSAKGVREALTTMV